jgi:polygalacturonase
MLTHLRRPGLSFALVLPIILSGVIASADPPLPSGIPSATFNVTSYGASTSNSAAANATDIQNAIAACLNAGGGSVVIPSGTFVSDPISISGGNLNLEINGTLQAPVESTYVTDSTASTDLINWNNAANAELSGTGTIDGQGSTWWTAGTNGAPLSTRPQLVHFSNAQTLLVTGVSLINSPKEFFSFGGSKTNNVTFNGININAPSNSPNTDGIDVDGSNFLIENSTISNGDDNIAMTAFTGNAPVNNVTITNMTFGTGHGVSVGDEVALGVSNVTVTNSTFNGDTNGIRLKSGRGNGGVVSNLTYSNLTMTNVQNPIYISSWYVAANGGFTFPATPQTASTAAFDAATTPQWQNINISNLTSTDSASNSIAGLIYGLPESLVQGVTLDNVNITAKLGMSLDYAGTSSAPIAFEGNWSIDPTGGGPQFGTFSNPNNSNPGTLSTGIYDSVLVVPEPASAGIAMLALAPLLLARPRKTPTNPARFPSPVCSEF